ncbi:MAG: iron transporter [Deltaproteobacteria bacterium]|jgi:Fe2+ transport system protein B|nr:iron transporter [Deltaproteobacteria bacterium]MBW2250898.1 iron transporter [Deltaproteobacteria bacterium]
MDTVRSKLKQGLTAGVKKGWDGFLWMLKILVPISLFTALFEYSGWIYKISFLLEPGMNLLNLPPIAVLPLMVGLLTGIYGGIAAMVTLPLTHDQMTLVAIFILISHNLIQEGVIQGKSGMHPFKATVLRLSASIITVLIVSLFLQTKITGLAAKDAAIAAHLPLLPMLQSWLVAMFNLSLKMFAIIMVLMVLLECLKSFNMIQHFVKIMNPLLIVMGLNKRVGVLWLTATVFGIAYGGAVIVEEAREENLTKKELERLHLSIGINHSMIEDPALFLALGLSAFWMWIPRLITAVVAVRLFDLYSKIKL